MNREIVAIDHARILKPTICNTELTFSVKIDGMNIAAVFIRHIFKNKADAFVEICLSCKGYDSLQFGGFHTQNYDYFFIKSKLKLKQIIPPLPSR